MNSSTTQAEVTTDRHRFDHPRISDQYTVDQAQKFAKGLNIYAFNVRVVPVVEVIVGLLLILGLFSRVGGLVIINMMLVATYVHLVVDNPALFPLQPKEPVIPLISIAVAAYILWRGAGVWSLDLKASS